MAKAELFLCLGWKPFPARCHRQPLMASMSAGIILQAAYLTPLLVDVFAEQSV